MLPTKRSAMALARAGLLDKPGAGGVGGDAEQVDPARGVLDDEERVQAPETDGVEVEQVAGKDRLCLCAEELRPARSCSPRRGVDAARCRMVQTVEAPIR